MAIAASVQKHLVREGVSYELIEHTRTLDSMHAAQAAHVPPSWRREQSSRTTRASSSRWCQPRERSTSAPSTGA